MKTLQRCCTLLLIASTVLAATGCATHDPRDRPWDPKPGSGHRLHDVLPNWEHNGSKAMMDRRCPPSVRWTVRGCE
jgi:hypothetical protein